MAMRVKKSKPKEPVRNRKTGPNQHQFKLWTIHDSLNQRFIEINMCIHCGLAYEEFKLHPNANCRWLQKIAEGYKRGLR